MVSGIIVMWLLSEACVSSSSIISISRCISNSNIIIMSSNSGSSRVVSVGDGVGVNDGIGVGYGQECDTYLTGRTIDIPSSIFTIAAVTTIVARRVRRR